MYAFHVGTLGERAKIRPVEARRRNLVNRICLPRRIAGSVTKNCEQNSDMESRWNGVLTVAKAAHTESAYANRQAQVMAGYDALLFCLFWRQRSQQRRASKPGGASSAGTAMLQLFVILSK